MAYRVFWIIQNRVLYISQSERVSLDDIRLSTKQIADEMDEAYASGAALVIGIVDLSGADLSRLMRSVVTTTMNEISEVVDSRLWKAKPGFIVLITASEAAKTIISLVVRLSSQPMTTVGTLDEALTVASFMYPELQTELKAYRHGDLPTGTTL